jgi:hypothetical protein
MLCPGIRKGKIGLARLGSFGMSKQPIADSQYY